MTLLLGLAGWRANPGPELPSAKGRAAMVVVDGVVVFKGHLQALMLDEKVGKWVPLAPPELRPQQGYVAIPGGLFVADAVIDPGPRWRHGALVWERKTGTWRRVAGSPRHRREQHLEMATALADGSVLLVGGAISGNRVIADAERWMPSTDTFVPAGALSSPRADGTITLLADGRVLVTGGTTQYGRFGATTHAEIYDPTTNTWTATDPLHVMRRGHTATRLPDGSVLVAGGQRDSNEAVAELEVWSPKTGRWTLAGRLREARSFHAAVALGDGRVTFIGGVTNDGPYVRGENGNVVLSVETWISKTSSWEPLWYPQRAHVAPAAARLPDGRIVIAGGFDLVTSHTRVEIWEPRPGPSAPWSLTDVPLRPGAVPPPPPDLRGGDTTVVELPGGALAVGGNEYRKLGAALADPSSTWKPLSMITPRTRHAVARLPDGRVMIVGGVGQSARPPHMPTLQPIGPPLADVEIFDPVKVAFVATGPLSIQRIHPAAAVLRDGRVLVCGGSSASVEIWSPKTGAFASARSMTAIRTHHTVTTLVDGRVVAIGGDDDGTFEVYDPTTDRWTPPQRLPERWHSHAAVAATDGSVHVTTARDRTVVLRP